MPHRNPTGKVVDDPVELLDLFPTLADLCGLPPVPACPANSAGVKLCTQGRSLGDYVSSGVHQRSLSFAFSQYPRPSRYPSFRSDQPRLNEIRYGIWLFQGWGKDAFEKILK